MYDFDNAPAHAIGKLTDIIRVLDPAEHTINEDREIGRFRWDSRHVKPGDIFIAIPGARVDGHDFVAQARASGAAACLVSRWDHLDDKQGCILVRDTGKALVYLAACHRRALPTQIIGITGSVGKTTTKEILATLLSAVFRTKKSAGNLNSTIGLPVQILELRDKDQWMVAEMGMSFPGEIAALAKMAKPDIALWTAVRAVHMANFENLDGIARAKAELVENLARDKTLVYNRDDAFVTRYCKDFRGKKLSYGIREPAARVRARIEPYPDWKGVNFDLWVGNEEKLELYLPLVGRYNVYNALAACAAAAAAGVPPAELKYSLKTVRTLRGRASLHDFEGNTVFVDDTYNASPTAVDQVLRSFATLSPKTWRWLLLGDMLELGPQERQIHADLGRRLATYGFDRITLVGPLMAEAHEQLQRQAPPRCQIEYFASVDQAVSLQVAAHPHGRIWAKASRSIHLERVSEVIIEQLNRQKGH